MTTIYYILLTLFLVLSFFLILLVLIQKGRGGGLSAAFGGVGGNTAFGAKTGDVLTWATSIVFGIFLVLGISLNLMADSIHQQKIRNDGGKPTAAPATPVLPADNSLTPVADPLPATTQSTP